VRRCRRRLVKCPGVRHVAVGETTRCPGRGRAAGRT
jgi:hypothetical protein